MGDREPERDGGTDRQYGAGRQSRAEQGVGTTLDRSSDRIVADERSGESTRGPDPEAFEHGEACDDQTDGDRRHEHDRDVGHGPNREAHEQPQHEELGHRECGDHHAELDRLAASHQRGNGYDRAADRDGQHAPVDGLDHEVPAVAPGVRRSGGQDGETTQADL